MKTSYFFKHLIPWKILSLILILFISGFTIYLLIKFPALIKNEVLRDSVIIGITTSIIGSSIYTFLLWLLKPTFIISNKISYEEQSRVANGAFTRYLFKVINNSWFFDVQDVQVRLYAVSEYPNDENAEKYNTSRYDVPLIIDKISYIPRRTQGGIFKNRTANYAQLFATTDDLKQIFHKGETLEFQIYAKHSLSGFASISVKRYKVLRCIKRGSFAHGDNFDILE